MAVSDDCTRDCRALIADMSFIESYSGRLQDEPLNETLFPSLRHARAKLAA